MKVKVCGITDKHTALRAAEFGADALGFVFAKSRRMVTVQQAEEIIKVLPLDVMKVGVFVNETKENIEHIAKIAGLTHIQLHGDEDAAFSQKLTYPVIKAFSIRNEKDLESAAAFPSDYILLDSGSGPYRGGNGTRFDWTLAQNKFDENKKVILAGGLNAENIKDAAFLLKPYMADVSSGVETDGKKDVQKINEFIKSAKEGEL